MNGQELTATQPPVVRDGAVYVPFRELCQALGVQLQTQASRVVASGRGHTLQMAAGDSTADVDGRALVVNTVKVGGTLMVSPQLLADAFGYRVNASAAEVSISNWIAKGGAGSSTTTSGPPVPGTTLTSSQGPALKPVAAIAPSVAAAPVTAATKPVLVAAQPIVAVSEPDSAASVPATRASTPMAAAAKPVPDASKPMAAAAKPVPAASKPMPAAPQPVAATSKPVAAASKPVAAASKPVAAASKPKSAASKAPGARPIAGAPRPVRKPVAAGSALAAGVQSVAAAATTTMQPMALGSFDPARDLKRLMVGNQAGIVKVFGPSSSTLFFRGIDDRDVAPWDDSQRRQLLEALGIPTAEQQAVVQGLMTGYPRLAHKQAVALLGALGSSAQVDSSDLRPFLDGLMQKDRDVVVRRQALLALAVLKGTDEATVGDVVRLFEHSENLWETFPVQQFFQYHAAEVRALPGFAALRSRLAQVRSLYTNYIMSVLDRPAAGVSYRVKRPPAPGF